LSRCSGIAKVPALPGSEFEWPEAKANGIAGVKMLKFLKR
jgi:hypothetical protein